MSQPSTARSVEPAATTAWEIDAAHSSVQFSVRHMMVSTVRGHFPGVKGTILVDENDPSRSSVEVEIDASSVDTRDAKRDEHLRSPDFFDVAQHPAMRFRSTRVVAAEPGKVTLTGDLTLKGVTKPVTLAVEGLTPSAKDPYGRTVRGTSASARIHRKEWGLGWNAVLEAGGLLVGETVDLQIDLELVARP